jgi:hypothetical protein
MVGFGVNKLARASFPLVMAVILTGSLSSLAQDAAPDSVDAHSHASTVFAAARPWLLVATQDETQVYRSEIEGSPYFAIKAITLIKSDVESVVGAFDGKHAQKNGCSLSSYVYSVLDMPWPLSDRDIVARSQLTIDGEGGVVILDIVSDASHYPLQDHIRADANIRYVFRRLEGHLTEVIYINHTNLNGGVPASLFNSQVVSSTAKEMSALKSFVES